MRTDTNQPVPPAPAALASLGSAEDRDRFAQYPRLANFWNGDQWEERKRSKDDQRLVMNYARSLLRKTVSYTLGDVVHHEIVTVTDSEAEAKQQLENRLNAELAEAAADELDHQMLTDAVIYGESVAKITWSNERQSIQLAAIHPNNILIWADPARRNVPVRLLHGYYLPGLSVAAHFGLPETVQAGATNSSLYPVIEEWTVDRRRVTVDGQALIDEENPYGLIPYATLINEPSTGHLWGMSDLDDLLHVCREINRRLSTLANILELSGAPIAVLENVDGSEGVTVRPGSKWEIPKDAKAYLLDLLAGGGVDLHIKAIDEHRQSLHDLSETPRSAFGDTGRQLSGAALEVELQPLVQKVRRKRRALRAFYARRNEIVLRLLEKFAGEAAAAPYQTRPIWPAILPSDTDSDTANAVALVAAGIRSRRSVAADLGEPDPDRELNRVLEEAAQFASSQNSTSTEEPQP